ncbi:uncharacterized protein GGS22DRAFT_191992 [Annulohypoxylon maeteangense]|uniref:uncharacterized protein n=1 Tax=Annulohypoxylon maeteangense TaxID=1927788 RepID=UPI00200895DF|nr:uncharacterized protein GGS22DRAFT_191992 [Annulohypoxylon maeteangense]KAI0881798.1 hypothetical protein GGS22DRAFT_191992 [Annulohypoxylon maeteangense]
MADGARTARHREGVLVGMPGTPMVAVWLAIPAFAVCPIRGLEQGGIRGVHNAGPHDCYRLSGPHHYELHTVRQALSHRAYHLQNHGKDVGFDCRIRNRFDPYQDAPISSKAHLWRSFAARRLMRIAECMARHSALVTPLDVIVILLAPALAKVRMSKRELALRPNGLPEISATCATRGLKYSH